MWVRSSVSRLPRASSSVLRAADAAKPFCTTVKTRSKERLRGSPFSSFASEFLSTGREFSTLGRASRTNVTSCTVSVGKHCSISVTKEWAGPLSFTSSGNAFDYVTCTCRCRLGMKWNARNKTTGCVPSDCKMNEVLCAPSSKINPASQGGSSSRMNPGWLQDSQILCSPGKRPSCQW